MKSLLVPALAAAVLALPAAAQPMTDAERDAFRAEVRAYLLENPEVLMEAIAVLEERQAAKEAENDRAALQVNREILLNSAADWSGGNPRGDVTLVEFVDYRCGYCRRAHQEVTDLVELDGNIRIVLKEFPILGEASLVSSRFAIAVLQLAGPETYWRAHEELITLRGEPSPDLLAGLAGDLGLDPAAVAARMQAPEVTEVIAANRRLADALQVSGTPTFVVTGPKGAQMLRGYLPPDAMAEVVAAQRGG